MDKIETKKIVIKQIIIVYKNKNIHSNWSGCLSYSCWVYGFRKSEDPWPTCRWCCGFAKGKELQIKVRGTNPILFHLGILKDKTIDNSVDRSPKCNSQKINRLVQEKIVFEG